MRELHVSEITEAVSRLCIEANHKLSPDMEAALERARQQEASPLGSRVLAQLSENLEIAGSDQIPICQDTGMAVVFLDLGQDLHLIGGDLESAVNEGVRRGYSEGYLRKSVADPITRINTGDNTPGILHVRIVPGDRLKITVAPKGFGSENMSRIFMLKPADGREGILRSIVQAAVDAGPNACPPMVVGVGIGGTFERCAELAKRALLVPADHPAEDPTLQQLEEEALDAINRSGIGPGGLGGTTTALAVHILSCPTHIAGLPVAVNICCHVDRHASAEL